MANDVSFLDGVAGRIVAETAAISPLKGSDPAGGPPICELFYELLVLALANLYGRVPLSSNLFNRAMLKVVTSELDDKEAGQLIARTEDWIRLEGLVRILEGQKSYTLNRVSLAVLSTPTAHGLVGEIMQKVAECYLEHVPTAELRGLTRQLASYFMMRLGRS